MKIAKKIVRIFAIVVVCVIGLNIILFLTFSFQPVQKFAADFAIGKLEPKLKTEMAVERIRIKLFNRVEIGGFMLKIRGVIPSFCRNLVGTTQHLESAEQSPLHRVGPPGKLYGEGIPADTCRSL